MSESIYMPASQKHKSRERAKARELRRSQWWRQKVALGICHHCGQRFSGDELTMDHLVPVARGGRSNKGNVVASCKICNSHKAHRTPVEVRLAELGLGNS